MVELLQQLGSAEGNCLCGHTAYLIKGSMGGEYYFCTFGHIGKQRGGHSYCIQAEGFYNRIDRALMLAYLVKMDERTFLKVANSPLSTRHLKKFQFSIEGRR